MAEAKPVQPFADRAAMRRKAMNRREFGHDLVQRQAALDRDPLPQPCGIGGEFAWRAVALRLRRKAPLLALEDHHVVHEAWRHPEVPCCLSMPVTFLDKGDHPGPQFHRMWLAHSEPP